jgi:branched-chain amino acid transport system substrate-binding protein
MSRSRWSQAAAVLVAATMLLAACGGNGETERSGSPGGQDASAGKKTVALAFVGAQTGDNANLGINISNGARQAIDEANAKGDLPVKVTLKIFDTQGSETQAPGVAQKVVADSSIVGIIGPAFSGESNAANPIFDQAGIPLITPSATRPSLSQQGWKVFHRLLANDTAQGTESAKYIAKSLKVTTAAFIHDNTDYGKGLVDVVKRESEALGVKTAVFEAIDPKGTDYSATVNKIKASRAALVYYAGYYAEAGRFIKQLRDKGVTATFLSGDGSKDPGFVQAAGAPAAEGAELTCPCADAAVATDPTAQAFAAAYTKAFGQPPGTYSGEAYDAANIFLAAMRAGKTTKGDILTFIDRDLGTFKGVTKDVTFREDGEITTGTVYIYVVKGGKITVKGKSTELAA